MNYEFQFAHCMWNGPDLIPTRSRALLSSLYCTVLFRDNTKSQNNM